MTPTCTCLNPYSHFKGTLVKYLHGSPYSPITPRKGPYLSSFHFLVHSPINVCNGLLPSFSTRQVSIFFWSRRDRGNPHRYYVVPFKGLQGSIRHYLGLEWKRKWHELLQLIRLCLCRGLLELVVQGWFGIGVRVCGISAGVILRTCTEAKQETKLLRAYCH